MASPVDSNDEIYLEPYEDLGETNFSFSTSRSKIEDALRKPTNVESKVTGYSKNSNGSTENINNYENIDGTTGVHFSAQRKNINDDNMGIYFTPEDVPGESPKLRHAASSQHNKSRKSRYDSNMYALPDPPTGLTTTSNPLPDSCPPPPPSENGRSAKRRTIIIIVISLCVVVLLISGTGVVITVMSQNDKNDTGNETYMIKYGPLGVNILKRQ